MSTNIKVQRICQFCGKEFTARTTVTQYCGDNCSKRAYKARQRATKVETSNKETLQIKTKPIEELKVQEFLSVRHVAKLIGSSRQTVYNLINTGKLQAVNILKKKTIVRRCDLDNFSNSPLPSYSRQIITPNHCTTKLTIVTPLKKSRTNTEYPKQLYKIW